MPSHVEAGQGDRNGHEELLAPASSGPMRCDGGKAGTFSARSRPCTACASARARPRCRARSAPRRAGPAAQGAARRGGRSGEVENESERKERRSIGARRPSARLERRWLQPAQRIRSAGGSIPASYRRVLREYMYIRCSHHAPSRRSRSTAAARSRPLLPACGDTRTLSALGRNKWSSSQTAAR